MRSQAPESQCLSPPGARLGPYEIARRSARAAWARSTAPGTRGSTARSRSRSCPRTSPPTPSVASASSARRRDLAPSTIRTSARSTTSVTRDGDRLPGHGVSRGRDARRPAARGALPLDQVLALRDRDRRRARQGAPAGHRPSRPEARQRHADEDGREAARLRPGEARGAGAGARRADAPRLPTRGQPLTAAGHASSARSSTWRPSSSRGTRPTPAPTSSRSAPCSTRWRPGKAPFAGEEPGEPDRRDHVARPPPPISTRAPMTPPALDRLVREPASPRIRTSAGRPRTTCAASCAGSRKAGRGDR